MNQVTRTEQIDTILKKIDAQIPYEMGVALETYISKLEDNQKVIQLDNTTSWGVDNPPIWSQARVEKRAQRRRERAARKRNDYQSIKPL
jgi:hypothetical protein